MENSQLIGRIKGAPTLFTRYRPAGNNIYNSTTKLQNLYDTLITTPTNNQVLYLLTTFWRNKTLQATGGLTSNIYWFDMYGNNVTTSNSPSQTFTYSNASSKYIQYQKLTSDILGNGVTYNTTLLNTGALCSLINTNDFPNYAISGGSVTRNNSFFSSGVMTSYLFSNTSGILLRNECYDRNFEINAYISIYVTAFNPGSSFKLFLYLGNNVIAQTQVFCNSITDPVYINLYGLVRTSVVDVDKYIDFRIQYLGSGLTTRASGFQIVVRTL
jgi:hypothetical protein